jgi:2-methylisocitrate lyase-like PEP mutase family enzyme
MQLMTDTGLPFCTAVVEGTKTEEYSIKELEGRGFKIVKYPQTLIRSSMKNMTEALDNINKSGFSKESDGFVVSADKRNELTDLTTFNHIEEELNKGL